MAWQFHGALGDYKYLIDSRGVWNAEGNLVYPSSNFTVAAQWAFNNLTPSRTWKERIVIHGNFTATTAITVSSFTTINVYGKITLGNAANSAIFSLVSVNDVDIFGGNYDGNRANQNPPLGHQESVVYCTHCYNIRVVGLYIANSMAHGIAFEDTDGVSYHCEASGNTIYNSYNDGVNVGGSSKIDVVDNRFYYMGHVAVVLTGSYDCTVVDNVCDASGQRATFANIYLFGGSYQNSIVGNICVNALGAGGHGIFIGDGYSNTVEGNVCATNGGNGILIYDSDYNIISNNIARAQTSATVGAGAGIRIDIGVGTANYNSVSGNHVYGNKDGIFSYQGFYNLIHNNYVVSNTRYGIYLSGANLEFFEGNRVYNNTGNGFQVDSDSNNNLFTGNWTLTNAACIRINNANCDTNKVWGNNFDEGAISDIGTGTVAFDNFDPSGAVWIASINAPAGGR